MGVVSGLNTDTDTMRNTKLLFLLPFLHSAAALTVQDLPEMGEDGEQWVVLVAGSKTWRNYRHQADICHAYQIVHDHGVPEDHIIVFATTASNSKKPSMAYMWDSKRQTYLADMYSIKWMQNSDQNNIQEEALDTQYRVVKRETTLSPVCQFGDKSMGKMAVGDFQGRERASQVSLDSEAKLSPSCPSDAVASPEVPVAILQKRI